MCTQNGCIGKNNLNENNTTNKSSFLCYLSVYFKYVKSINIQGTLMNHLVMIYLDCSRGYFIG